MIHDIIIVGGGTAGWMTATYLKRSFGDRASITLIESEQLGRIGVGEATFSTIRNFFDHLALRESDWMPRCNATYKLAIRFEDWRQPGHHFYHPFERPRVVAGFPLSAWWLKLYDDLQPFDDACFVLSGLCDALRAPRQPDGTLLESLLHDGGNGLQTATMGGQAYQFPYAYHFDATLLAEFLSEYGRMRNVRHVVDDVVNVELDERGWITHVQTRRHGRLSGQLFIDCTGFRGLLIDKAHDEPFLSYHDVLPNNRAVAIRVPTDVSNGIRPYTTATAQEAGWIWTIPLFGRNGLGYVYSDEFCSSEDAEVTLRRFVEPDGADLPVEHIRMRVGRHRRSWVKNCVAIGLSSGFVEPLESTGIFFIQHGLEQLVKHFPDCKWNPVLRAAYNKRIAECLDGVCEFLALHYKAAGRQDTPYWMAAKTRNIPDGLAERMELWRARLPDADAVYPHYHGFEPYSYEVMLLGLGFRPQRYPAALDLIDNRSAREEFARVAQARHRLIAELPSHYKYFSAMRGGA